MNGIGTLSSPSCKSTNVFSTNNNDERQAMDIGVITKTPQLESSIDTYFSVIDSIDRPQGVHKIKTALFSEKQVSY